MADNTETNDTNEKKGMNFVEQIVYDDLQAGKNDGRLNTRFPPEPNGYLHIGHAKAICMDFGIAEKFGGTCNLRFDDTNPVKEDVEYVDSIREDIHWLGFDWGDREYYASDYFPQLYALAERLIREGKAYVDDQSSEEIAAQKGSPTVPGINSPYRDRTPEENLDLFHRMNAGEFEEGSRVLRAKIDMASDNMHFRDPIMYRIIKTPHHRTGTQWKVYPMYDFAMAKRFLRRRHPLDMYTRICPPSSAVRVFRQRIGQGRQLLSATNRVQPSQSYIYCHEQAQTAPAGNGRARSRMG